MKVSAVFKNLNINGTIVDIVCDNGVITNIGKTNLDGIDFFGKTAYAGLVDIHTHGMGGFDTMDADLLSLAKLYAASGTTSFMPTTMTADNESIRNVLNSDYECDDGADVIGFHLEGPYINAEYAGAQNRTHIRLPDIEEAAGFDNIGMVTVAPELDGAIDFIKKSDAVIALGHTAADYEKGIEAAQAGAKCITHTFNAMKPLHHRLPGLLGAAFDENMYIQVICDGIHIHPSVIRLLYRLFGTERMILISDSMRATGLADGEYDLGGQFMKVENGVARTADGALAGSTSTLFDCVKCAISFGIPEKDAFLMASKTPSQLMNVKKGMIEVGYDCDLIVLDENKELKDVIIGGKIIGR